MTTSEKIVLLNPLGHMPAAATQAVVTTKHRADGLNGATLGVLTNMFRGEDLPAAVSDVLKRTYGMSVVRFVKPSLSHVSKEEIIDEMAQRVDCAVVGMCG